MVNKFAGNVVRFSLHGDRHEPSLMMDTQGIIKQRIPLTFSFADGNLPPSNTPRYIMEVNLIYVSSFRDRRWMHEGCVAMVTVPA